MTRSKPFVSLTNVVADLSRDMSPQLRYAGLLDAFLECFPCDAIALLKCEGDQLVLCASDGLLRDMPKRRFPIADHPRFAQILRGTQPIRFAADSNLPDPYDGLVNSVDQRLHVHDCMGAPLYVDGAPWGIVTLDATSPASFDQIDHDALHALLLAAVATICASGKIPPHPPPAAAVLTYPDTFDNDFIGRSPQALRIRREAEIVARTDFPILIQGEPGVGKDLVAQLIHRLSGQARRPIIRLSCAALPQTLSEGELANHLRGMFTTLVGRSAHDFGRLHRGTAYIDDVEALSLSMQKRLLHALQESAVRHSTRDQVCPDNIRVIAATQCDLAQAVAQGRFRSDLYHHLSTYLLEIPPLRERGEDLPLLAEYFTDQLRRRLGLRNASLSRGAHDWLLHQPWTGNVRELKNTLARALIRALCVYPDNSHSITLNVDHLRHDGAAISDELMHHASLALQHDTRSLQEIVDSYRRDVIRARLNRFDGNKTKTAHSLGVDRGNFHRLLKKLGLD